MPTLTPPNPNDPPDVANASQGALQFRTLKAYIDAFNGVMFDVTTGLFLPTTIIPTTALPALAGDVSSTAQTNIVTVKKINGVALSGLATGILGNTAGTGQPSILTVLPTGTTAATPASADNSQKVATTAYVNAIATARGQFIGTNTNDAATAGNIGEFVQSLVASGSAIPLTTNTPTNVTSISLTAGDWDVSGLISYALTGATTTAKISGINTASATLPTDGTEVYSSQATTIFTGKYSEAISRKRFSLNATTTIYLIANATFSAGTITAFGQLSARRMR